MAVYNNLYPPVVETYMPAFLVDSENEEENVCKLYFSISDYNTIDDIKNAQITVRDQETNLSVLDSVKYPTEIMLTNILTDENIKTSYKCIIDILSVLIILSTLFIKQHVIYDVLSAFIVSSITYIIKKKKETKFSFLSFLHKKQ